MTNFVLDSVPADGYVQHYPDSLGDDDSDSKIMKRNVYSDKFLIKLSSKIILTENENSIKS